MIVKVQLSQFDSEGRKMMLIYDKKRNFRYEDEATDEIIKLMNGSQKDFFEAELIDDEQKKGAKKILLHEKTRWQNW